jgi:SAM-dependent methyltransferase
VNDLSESNALIFQSAKLADWYADQSLCPAETMILLRHRDAFAGKRVLDVGVGSGRTTRFLLPFAAHYVGLDLSPQMLARCRHDFPQASLHLKDVRDIADLSDEPFDFVMASWAVLDALAPDDRAKAIQDIARLTRPGGLFVLSAHNREATMAGQRPAMRWTARPDRLINEAAHFFVASWNYQMRAHLRSETEEYAVFNDMAHRWTGVFYYIDRAQQIAQLNEAGFDTLDVVGENGRSVPPAEETTQDGCLHFVALKRQATSLRQA